MNHESLTGKQDESGIAKVGFRTSYFSILTSDFSRLLREETAVTTLEYVVAALAVALGAVAGSRAIAGGLAGYLRRIYMVVTLPIP